MQTLHLSSKYLTTFRVLPLYAVAVDIPANVTMGSGQKARSMSRLRLPKTSRAGACYRFLDGRSTASTARQDITSSFTRMPCRHALSAMSPHSGSSWRDIDTSVLKLSRAG